MRQPAGEHLFEIYITPFCFGSDRARMLAEQVRSWQIPRLMVRLYDLSDPRTMRPAHVIAVPAYVLDGQLISLGTPDESWLRHLLTSGPLHGA